VPLPSAGSSWDEFPGVISTMSTLRHPPPPSVLRRPIARRFRPKVAVFAPAAGDHCRGPGVGFRVPLSGLRQTEVGGLSRVPGKSVLQRPALGPRRDLGHLAMTMPRCGRQVPQTQRLPRRWVISGLNHAALQPAVYASHPAAFPQSRKTRFRLVANLYRAGTCTR
jgi:hypothetical protein